MSREDHDVPATVRAEVVERDGSCCRMCGQWVRYPALHHIDYRSQGGLHVPSNLVVLGWLPGHDCHLPVAHANKRLWQPLLQTCALTPGVTAFALRRQLEAPVSSSSAGPVSANVRSQIAARREELLEARRARWL